MHKNLDNLEHIADFPGGLHMWSPKERNIEDEVVNKLYHLDNRKSKEDIRKAVRLFMGLASDRDYSRLMTKL